MFFIALIYIILDSIGTISMTANIVTYFHTPNIIGGEEIQAEKMQFYLILACAARTLKIFLLKLI